MAKYSRLPKKKENERVSVLQSHSCKRVALMLCGGAHPVSCIFLDQFTIKHQLGVTARASHVQVGLCMVLSGSLLPQATESSGVQFLLLLRDFLELNYFQGLQTFA